MDVEAVWGALGERVRPSLPLAALGLEPAAIWVTLGVGVLAVVLRAPWRVLRVVVTVVHELGHAVVGVLVGRSFTGLVLRPDMSGHAVTVGRARGPGRVATTWAGYPAPGLVGAGLVLAAAAGWAPPVLLAIAALLLVGLVRSRSVYTAAVMVAATAGVGWLWWAGPERVQGLVLLAVGTWLVLGAWRHLAAVASARDAGSDPAVLARLTRVPAVVWTASFAVVLAAAAWVTVTVLWELVR